MLLAAALLLTAAVTAAGFLNQGIKLFAKLSASAREESAAVCLVKMCRDLRNAAEYSLIPFVKGGDSVAFATLEDLSTVAGDPDPVPYGVSYRFDAENGRILRETSRGQTFERPAVVRTETALTGVRSLQFEYEGEPDQLPNRVTVRIEYEGHFGSRAAVREVLLQAAPVRTERR